MRKIIIALLLVVGAIACKKQTYCWECRATATIYSGGTEISRETIENDVCDMTVSEMKDFCNDNSRTIKEGMGASANVRTICYIKP